jgi:murein DD-endopeptidase MepM/ murein hydrolase activator NlpD
MGQSPSPVKESSPEALTPDAINFGSNLSSAETATTVKEMRPTAVSAASPLDSSSGSSPAKTETVAVVTTPTPVNVWTAKDLGSGTPVQSVKESSIKPYENRLQSDLSRLRAEYDKTHQASQEENTSADVQAERSHPVNPEFKAEYAQAIRTEKTPHQSRHWLEQVQRLRTEQLSPNAEEPTQPVARSSDNRTIVATAPIGAAGYDPLKNPVLERMVSPELPPLPGADRYLPGGSPRSQGFIWPSKGDLTSGYGWRWGRMHRGIDIAASIGTPIVAADNGLVTYAGWNDGGYGYLVEITHSNGSVTLYAHNDRILVREGQQVTQGQQISEMGSTGFSTGPHLHFEIHPTGKGAVDPMAFLPSTNSVASGFEFMLQLLVRANFFS